MGDIIETTITAFEPVLYYKVSNRGMWFDIKTHSRANVGLTKKIVGKCLYWIQFENPGKITINEIDGEVVKTGLPFTLSQDEYRRFWVAWDSKSLRIGIGNTRRVISTKISSELEYITFSTRDQARPSTFRFEVSPLSLRTLTAPHEPKIERGNLHWTHCDNQLPDEAVIGGYIDGETVYVIRARYRNSLTPGVFVPSKGVAYIPWGGNANPVTDFEALCGYNFTWKPASENRIPVDALVAGHSEDNHEPLYIGRALDQDNKIPGKVQLSHKVCYIPSSGREKAVKQRFEVLTVPGLNGHSANTKVAIVGNRFADEYVDYEEQEGSEPDYESE